jgi:uncharacterized Zn finger protein
MATRPPIEPREPWRGGFADYGRPIAADGIATEKQRGAMADSWWSRRFVDVLESYGLGGRMQRGRTYARKGQVLTLAVRPSVIVAQVQGSRPAPYAVQITMRRPAQDAQWDQIEAVMGATVGFVARLLADEVPSELEDVFEDAEVDLFPLTWSALDAACSCPDHENPCKHIAAVLYLFADRLDRDPWLLIAWHGRSRDDVLDLLRARRGAVRRAAEHNVGSAAAAIAPWWPLAPGVPLPVSSGAPAMSGPPESPSAVLDSMEPLARSVVDRPVTDVLAELYAALMDEAVFTDD